MNAITPSPLRTVVDDVVLAYVEWREESATVWDAYHRSAGASAEDKLTADAVYRAALDREEAAAKSYAELIELARDWLETGCAHLPLARGLD